jgi:hypothetical protein
VHLFQNENTLNTLEFIVNSKTVPADTIAELSKVLYGVIPCDFELKPDLSPEDVNNLITVLTALVDATYTAYHTASGLVRVKSNS